MTRRLRLFQIVLGPAVALALSLQRLDWPGAFWSGKQTLAVGLVWLVALVTTSEGVARLRGESRELREVLLRDRIGQLLGGTLARIVMASNLSWQDVAVNVFVVRKGWRGEHQERIARLRLHYVAPSGIRWTKGKGVIGKCWALGKDVGRNLAAEFGGLAGIQKDDWEAMPADFREGLTFEEFERTWDLIGCVVAVPIVAPSGAYLGCVSVDAPGDSYGALWTPQVRQILAELALSVSLVLTRLSSP